MVPTMMGYFVGWAVGNAFVQALVEIAEANPALCSNESGCNVLNFFYSTTVTLFSAIIIIGLQP